MWINPLLAIDFYKVDHRRQYPPNTTEIYSNFTARSTKPCANIGIDFDNQVVMFGLQGFIKEYLLDFWDKFFSGDCNDWIKHYKAVIESGLGIKDFNCDHLKSLHNLGYLPIRIKAIREGNLVPIGVPLFTIVNTHPDFFWLTNYLETLISSCLWKPITSATLAFEFRKLFEYYAKLTGSPEEFVLYQGHDFSFRGMSGIEDAVLSGAAHLTSFRGTDTVPALTYLAENYEVDAPYIVGQSIPATEHSVMTCLGKDGEIDIIKQLITEVYPSGNVSIVLDSYDFWHHLTVTLKELKPLIMARDGKVVIRPDSGDPFKIICGNPHDTLESARAGALKCLWELFGGTINEKGYEVLDPHIGLIYGDSITLEIASKILAKMESDGFASSNIGFGIGSYTYQYVTRDTFGFAMKATSAVIDGKRHAIFKEPKTGDGKKKSAKGLLSVFRNPNTNRLELLENVSELQECMGDLHTVFENGELLIQTTLPQIRKRIGIALKSI